jgi:hypothetical protein
MRHRFLSAALAVSVLVIATPASAAFAADAAGCSGTVQSYNADGTKLGAAAAPGKGGTQSNPLPVDAAGTVKWSGSTEAAITDGSWSVSVMGLPVLKGSINNPDGMDQASGEQDVSALSGTVGWLLKGDQVVPVSGELTGTGGSCTASGYITGTGSPTGAPLFLLGVLFSVLGLVLIVMTVVKTKVVGVAFSAPTGDREGAA